MGEGSFEEAGTKEFEIKQVTPETIEFRIKVLEAEMGRLEKSLAEIYKFAEEEEYQYKGEKPTQEEIDKLRQLAGDVGLGNKILHYVNMPTFKRSLEKLRTDQETLQMVELTPGEMSVILDKLQWQIANTSETVRGRRREHREWTPESFRTIQMSTLLEKIRKSQEEGSNSIELSEREMTDLISYASQASRNPENTFDEIISGESTAQNTKRLNSADYPQKVLRLYVDQRNLLEKLKASSEGRDVESYDPNKESAEGSDTLLEKARKATEILKQQLEDSAS